MVAPYEPNDYTLDDFRRDLTKAVRTVDLLRWLPGPFPFPLPAVDEKVVRRLSGIIDAMTQEERRHPTQVIDGSRCQRVAAGADVLASDVSNLVSQFKELCKVMKRIKGMRRT